MSPALTTRTVRTPAGSGRDAGPVTSVTSWPARAAAFAHAKPIFPLEALDRNRTASRYSRVGPAVTRTLMAGHRSRGMPAGCGVGPEAWGRRSGHAPDDFLDDL